MLFSFYFKRFAAFLIILLSLYSELAMAGFLIAPSAGWTNFAFRPVDDEPTPNYFGYNGRLLLGYSFKQKLDFGLSGQYVPATLKSAKLHQDATLQMYDFNLGVRIADAVYVGGHYGLLHYRLNDQTADYEALGEYSGNQGGVELGAIFRLDKSNFWQISVDFGYADVTGEDENGLERNRIIDMFVVRLTYVYNHFSSNYIESSVIGKFMDSMLFNW